MDHLLVLLLGSMLALLLDDTLAVPLEMVLEKKSVMVLGMMLVMALEMRSVMVLDQELVEDCWHKHPVLDLHKYCPMTSCSIQDPEHILVIHNHNQHYTQMVQMVQLPNRHNIIELIRAVLCIPGTLLTLLLTFCVASFSIWSENRDLFYGESFTFCVMLNHLCS